MIGDKYKIRKVKRKRRTNLLVILRGKKIKQKELAQMADLELYQVSNIVTGKQKDLLMSTAKKICNALNVSLDEAFGETGDCEHHFKNLMINDNGDCICKNCNRTLIVPFNETED